MQIGILADRAGVSTETIRFYEKRGLISSERRANNYREFVPATVALVAMIRQAQKLGFSLAEISQIAGSLQDSTMGADQVEALLRDKIAELEMKARDILGLRDILAARLADVCPLGLGVQSRRQVARAS